MDSTRGFSRLLFGKDHPCVIFADKNLPEGMVALIAVGILFLLPVDRKQGTFTITWHEAMQIDWGTIILMGVG